MDRASNSGESSQTRERVRRERVSRKKSKAREKVESRETLCCSMFWGSRGSKNRLAKAAGAQPSGRMRDQKLHPAVGAKHALKAKCTNHFGALLEV